MAGAGNVYQQDAELWYISVVNGKNREVAEDRL